MLSHICAFTHPWVRTTNSVLKERVIYRVDCFLSCTFASESIVFLFVFCLVVDYMTSLVGCSTRTVMMMERQLQGEAPSSPSG